MLRSECRGSEPSLDPHSPGAEHIANLYSPWAGRRTPSWSPQTDRLSSSQVDLYDSDPLICRAGVKVCFGIQLMNAVSRVERAMPKLTLPFLLLQGSADRLCDSKGAYLLMESSRSQDKTLKVRDRRHDPPACLGSNGAELEANERCDSARSPTHRFTRVNLTEEENNRMVWARERHAVGHGRQCLLQASGLPAMPQCPLYLLRVHRYWGLRTHRDCGVRECRFWDTWMSLVCKGICRSWPYGWGL